MDVDCYDKIEELDKEKTGLCNTKKRKIAMSIHVYVYVRVYKYAFNWM